jgi:hypothetical protein
MMGGVGDGTTAAGVGGVVVPGPAGVSNKDSVHACPIRMSTITAVKIRRDDIDSLFILSPRIK